MSDVLLYRSLLRGELAAPAVSPVTVRALRALAARPLDDRLAYLGPIADALAAGVPDAAARGAAFACLGGALGPTALRLLVDHLATDDDALPAFRESCLRQPERWAHALFHPEPAVRRRALALEAPPAVASWPALLRVDPACADAVPDGAPLPRDPAVLLDLGERGLVSAERAVKALADVGERGLATWLERGRARAAAELPPLAAHPSEAERGADVFDALFAFLARADVRAEARARPRLLEHLLRASEKQAPLARRAWIALLVLLVAGEGDAELLGLAARLDARILRRRDIAAPARRQTLRALGPGARLVAPSGRSERRELARALLASPLVRGEGGALDLVAAASAAAIDGRSIYAVLDDAIGLDGMLDAFVRAPLENASLLAQAGAGQRDRDWFLARLAERAGPSARQAEALVILEATVEDERLEGALPPTLARRGSLLEALFALAGPRGLSAPRTRRLARKLVERAVPDPKISGEAAALLRAWLALPAPEHDALGLHLVGLLGRRLETEPFARVALGVDADGLDAAALERLVHALPSSSTFPWAQERHLAEHLLDHPREAVRAWAAARCPAEPGVEEPPPPPTSEARALDAKERAAVLSAGTRAELDEALRCAHRPRRGVAPVLAERRPIVSVAACVALVGAHDPPQEVADELACHAREAPRFLEELERAAVDTWLSQAPLSLTAHAWLFRWEAHAIAATRLLAARGLPGALRQAARWPFELLGQRVWKAVARAFGVWRWQPAGREEMATLAPPALLDALVDHLDTEVGEAAADALGALHSARVVPKALVSRMDAIEAKLPDASSETRARLAGLVRARGLPPRARGAARVASVERVLAALRASEDVAELEARCHDRDRRIAEEAALRLAELEAHVAIERLLVNGGAGAVVAARVAGLLPDAARERLRALLPGASTPLAPEVRFRLAMELGEPEHAASAARAPLEGESWLGEADALALRDALGDDAFARALAPSPHPRAYRAAMRLALWRPRDFADTLRAFLEQGAEREVELRRAVAKVLRTELGDDLGAPLWIARAFEVAQGRGPFEGFPHLGPPTLASVLAAGDAALERCMLEWLDALPDPLDAAATLLAEGVGPVTRERAAARLGRAADRDALASRARRVRDLAEIFVWGMHRARELTGSVFRIHLTHGDALGYTRLTRQAIHVSGLPVLRGDRRARAIVEGLVLHELGHHVHHASGPALEVWAQAREEGLGGLLNLVADEHLERNLRARDATWGTRLRRLCAWAFQHTQRELSARRLVDALGLAAARVLPGAGLAIAHRPDAVRVRSGALLAALEAHRPAFARFVRALRMGLGDRHDDPAVRAGLALFDRRFRHRDMAGLLEIARALRRLYGEEARLVELVGGHETVPGAGREGEVCGEGIGDADVQEEVERILEAPSRSGARARPGKGRPVVNVGPRRDFDRIHDVRPAPPAPAAHAELARELARPARHLRRALEQLGLAHRPARFRLRGHRFDRTRARAVVLRGDPRMLVARERVRRADLFIGVAIDCSGSMGSGACMDKARRFGVLLAEAAAGLAGVDVRFVGFEDQVLWDAGSATRPAVAALEPGGGNNDAAALWHVAELARRSRRSARLLVMISDGLPTECSTTALRGLVRELEGEGLACAQVAVRALAERCFDHYVEVLEPDVAVASRAFGDIVTGLVARTLRG